MNGKARAQWADAFWTFSTTFYATPKVEATCLELQDRDGLEVNLVLFCLFAAQQHVRFERTSVQAMQNIGRVWGNEIVAPLRAVRRSLKVHEVGNEQVRILRKEVKRVELEAEKAMQGALIDLFISLETCNEAESPAVIAAHNLATWFDEEGIDSKEPHASVARLIQAAFG